MAQGAKPTRFMPRVVYDGLRNLVSGIGTPKDKSANWTYTFVPLVQHELEAMYATDWLSAKIVDIVPFDMTREWRTWQAKQAEDLYQAERDLWLKSKIRAALVAARLYGGAAILIGDGKGNPEKPLDYEKFPKDGIKYLHVFTQFELSADGTVTDINSQDYGKPEFYRINNPDVTSGKQVRVHRSRFAFFMGMPAPEQFRVANGAWGLSILDRVQEAVKNVGATAANSAALTEEAKVDVIKVPDLHHYLSTDEGTKTLTSRFAIANTLKSTVNMLLLGGDEEFDRKQVTWGGLPELMRVHLEIAAGAADVPLTRLLGTSPGGLNSTGESDIRNYYDNIRSKQTDLEENLEPLDECFVRHVLGDYPDDVTYEWNPLWQMTEAEEAEIWTKKMDAFGKVNGTNLLAPEELRPALIDMLVDGAWMPSLDQYIMEEAEFEKHIEEQLAHEEEMAQQGEVTERGALGGKGQGSRPALKSIPGGKKEDAMDEEVVDDDDFPFDSSDGFDPSKHPRAPKGSPQGGQFIQLGTEVTPYFMTHDIPTTDVATWKQIGQQAGSNKGGMFQDPNGVKWYVKQPATEDHINNDLLGNHLYQLAGANVPDEVPLTWNGKPALGSKMLDGPVTQLGKKAQSHLYHSEIQQHFAMDAWLANWDVVGLAKDNIVIANDEPYRVDQGGTMKYRAQGDKKGSTWNDTVSEFVSMREKAINPQSASVFGSMSDAQLAKSIDIVAAFTDDIIDKAANMFNQDDVAPMLKKRRDDLILQRKKLKFTDKEFEEEKHPRAPKGTPEGGQWTGEGRSKLVPAPDNRNEWPEHIQALKLPPGWTNVLISKDPNAALQAIGKDAKNRDQYVYSAAFVEQQQGIKFARIAELNEKYTSVHSQVMKDARGSDDRKSEHAECQRLVMEMGLRPGDTEDTGAEVKAYGATTLEGRHVHEDGKRLKFVGKKGVNIDLAVKDSSLQKMLRDRSTASGPDGQLFPNVDQKSLLDYVHTLNGGSFKTKDFRTVLATRTAFDLVEKSDAPANATQYKRKVREIAKQVSELLGNTPTVALQSYIHPAAFAKWRKKVGGEVK